MDKQLPPQPPALPPKVRASVEDEASKMNRGNGRQLAGMAIGVVALLGVGLLLLQGLGNADEYARATSAMAEIERVQFDGFVDCVFPTNRPKALGAEQVRASLQSIADSRGWSYGATLRACQPRLEALGASIQALQVPGAVESQRAKLVAASGTLSAANSTYWTYLSAGEKDYDRAAALPMQQAFGEASAGYEVAQSEFKQALAAKL